MTLVAVALTVAACGGDGDADADQTPASETQDEPAADSDDESDADAEHDGATVDAAALFAAIAGATLEAGSYEFESTVGTGGQELTVSGAIELGTDISEANMSLTMDIMGTGQAEVRVVDGQFYMEFPEGMGLPAVGSWITLDPDSADPFSQQMTGAFDEIGSATNLLAKLAEQPDLLTVTEKGSDTVDGVATTQYLVVVNDVAAFEGVPEAEASGDELSFTMWIDDDSLPRRVTTEAVGATIDMTYTNYGADVAVEAPPADEVIDLSELMNQ